MTEHDELQDEETTAALEIWEPTSAPEGFADRVLAARDEHSQAASSEPPRSSRTRGLVAAAGLGAAAAAAVAWIALQPEGFVATEGELTAQQRTPLSLGGRAVAVAEAGAELGYRVDSDGRSDIEQRAGAVFYRVHESDAPFVVHTPAGDVRVQGTCFSVEVDPMRIDRRGLGGVALGAAMAAAVVVTLYEGEVVLANEQGEVTLEPGDIAQFEPGEAPHVVEVHDAPSASVPIPALAEDATPDELRSHNEALRNAHSAQSDEIAELRAQLAAASAPQSDAEDPVIRPGHELREQWYPRSPREAARLAENCTLRLDQPDVMSLVPPDDLGDHADDLGLTSEERVILLDAVRRVHGRFLDQIRELYLEATGDDVGSQQLSPRAMLNEIKDKAAQEDAAGMNLRYARELAGLVEAPPMGDQSAYERSVRLFAGIGDELQSVLAQSLGAERAHELRAEEGGWPWSRSQFSGCPDED